MSKFIALLATLVAVAFANPIDPFLEPQSFFDFDVETKQSDANNRLNDDVLPIHYDILLTPYFENEGDRSFTFDGTVEMLVRATKENVVAITMHANQLTITDDWVVYEEGNLTSVIPHPPFQYDQSTNKLTLSLNRVLNPNINYVIKINYVGVLSDAMTGFYRSYYMENNVQKWLGTTQFQSTGARRAFPCFDEPKYKATFKVSMDRLNTYQPTLSNTKIEMSSPSTTGRTLDVFKKTPIMSSYLIAFIVSEFRGRQDAAQTNGLYARPQAYDQSAYSHDFLTKVLIGFDSFTDYDYLAVPELEKLDQASIPDFSAGAMENWGLMTYRDVNILFDPQHSTSRNKQRVATVVAHETAHQWFGDLVTCNYWDLTWLNEGFARYFEYFGTHWVENTWELDKQFVVEQLQNNAFQSDSLENTQAMSTEGASGNIIYAKAGSVIRMMEHMVSSNNFKLGLQSYLRTNAFKPVFPEYLWAAMQLQVPSLNIAKIMDSWSRQAGYPYITVTLEGTTVSITQKRYLQKHKSHTDMTTWDIPLTYATKESEFAITTPQEYYLREDGAVKRFSLAAAPESYFIMNKQQTGFYRVNYDTENWMKIKQALVSENHGGIHVLNRAQIVDDLFNFARTGIVDYATALDIVEYVKHEKEYIPWLPVFHAFTYLNRRLFGAEDQELLRYQVLDILADRYEELGYAPKADDSQTTKHMRTQVLTWLCLFGHEECLEKTREEFTKFKAAPETYEVNPDHRSLVYCQGLREGTEADFTMLWNRFLTHNVGHEQITVLSILGCTKVQSALRTFLDKMLTDDVRIQDKSSAFNSALNGNPENIDFVYDYVTGNMASWTANFGSVSSALSSIADRLTTEAQLAKLNAFLTANQVTLGAGGVQQVRNAIAETEWQWNWGATNGPAVREFLVDKKNSAASVSVSVLLVTMVAAVIMLLQ